MIRALALVAILVAPASAYASHTCGGGGGSSGSSSSSSSSSSGGDSGSSWSYTPTSSGDSSSTVSTGCVEDNDVVGYRQCTKFGAWGTNLRMPRFFLELGTNVRQFEGLGSHSGTVTHGVESFSYRMVMPDSDTLATAVTSTMRLGIGTRHGFYAGLEGELGGIGAQSGSVEMQAQGSFGSPQLDAATGMYMGAFGIAGVRGSAGRATFAIEGAGGVRSERYRFASTYHLCETTDVIAVTDGVVEARARAELWLNPWVTAGVSLGTSVVHRDDWLAGAYFGFHSRAFGGGR